MRKYFKNSDWFLKRVLKWEWELLRLNAVPVGGVQVEWNKKPKLEARISMVCVNTMYIFLFYLT